MLCFYIFCSQAVLVAIACIGWYHYKKHRRAVLRARLPNDLSSWRDADDREFIKGGVWPELEHFFSSHGFCLWETVPQTVTMRSPNHTLPCPGSIWASAADPKSLVGLHYFAPNNTLSCPARSREGRDVIIRVVAARNEGHDQLKILRRLATGPDSFSTQNHVIPMLQELVYLDITFAIFPKIAVSMQRSICSWPKNSVEDILDMILQALEAISFIHDKRIAHRDIFTDNFLLEWHPESLRLRGSTRPRVYMIDFETAVEFNADAVLEDCLSADWPISKEEYDRPLAPELENGAPYCPFKLDVWQFAHGLSCFRTTIADIDAVLAWMAESDAVLRPSAAAAKDKLCRVALGFSPLSLHIDPLYV